jgi:hypothetical protein
MIKILLNVFIKTGWNSDKIHRIMISRLKKELNIRDLEKEI